MQAVGRLHSPVRVIVLGAAGNAETEDAVRIERFRKIAHDMSKGEIHGQM